MYKRNESFRLTMDPAIPGTFQIVRIGEKTIRSKPGAMEVLDVSPSGLKIVAALDIHQENDVDLEVRFTLNTVEICLTGNIIWKKKETGKFAYGLRMIKEEGNSDQLISELKFYAKSRLTKS